MANVAGIGGRIEARAPIGFGGAATARDVLVFAGGQLSGFLNADDVVFQAQVGINVFLALVMAQDDARAVYEGEDAARDVEVVGKAMEQSLPQSLEILQVQLAHFAQQQASAKLIWSRSSPSRCSR